MVKQDFVFYNIVDDKFFNYAMVSLYTFYKYNDFPFYLFYTNLNLEHREKLLSLSDRVRVIKIKKSEGLVNCIRYHDISYIENISNNFFKCYDLVKNLNPNSYIVRLDLDSIWFRKFEFIFNDNFDVAMPLEITDVRINEKDYKGLKFNYCNFGSCIFNKNLFNLDSKYQKFLLNNYNDKFDYYADQDFANYLKVQIISSDIFTTAISKNIPYNPTFIHYLGPYKPDSKDQCYNNIFIANSYFKYFKIAKELNLNKEFIENIRKRYLFYVKNVTECKKLYKEFYE